MINQYLNELMQAKKPLLASSRSAVEMVYRGLDDIKKLCETIVDNNRAARQESSLRSLNTKSCN